MTRGRIVLVPFPFDDLATEKARPAVCLTEPMTAHRHIVLAFVTSRPSEDPLDTDIALDPQDWETAYAIDARLEGADLRVRASAAVSLYVFAIDDADQPLLVFPIPGRRPENPLVPGQETRLWVGAALVGLAVVAQRRRRSTPPHLGRVV